MKLGLNIGSVRDADVADRIESAVHAEELGYDVVWAAEIYGSSAPTVLSWIGSRTSRIHLGTSIMQIPARTPAMTAMTATTLDLLSEGRFRLGLGVSGPQVSEGWHGVRFAKPLGRTREYVEIVRAAMRREVVDYSGEHFTLPLPGGQGKPLKLMLRTHRPDIPVYLAAVAEKSLELTGEIADGWLAIFLVPEQASMSLAPLRRGLAKRSEPAPHFEISTTVSASVGDDPRACADSGARERVALYVGGMGSRKQNFYNDLARRMGFEQAAGEIQDLYLTGRKREAEAAVPFELIDQTALLGSKERIAERLHAYADAGVTTVNILPHGRNHEERMRTIRTVAEAFELSGLGESS